MAVHQFKNNQFNRELFPIDMDKKQYQWKKDYWLPALESKLEECRKTLTTGAHAENFDYNLKLISDELNKAIQTIPNFKIDALPKLNREQIDTSTLTEINVHLDELFVYYRDNYNEASNLREKKVGSMTDTDEKKTLYMQKQDRFHNESLEDFVTNKNDVDNILEEDGAFVQKKNLVYIRPVKKHFLGAHFYAPSKYLFGKQITTLSANVMVLWAMTVLMAVILFFDGMKKSLDFVSRILGKLVPDRSKNE
jgi:hypothetical protein